MTTANPYPTQDLTNMKNEQWLDTKLSFITRQQEVRDKRNELERECNK